MHPSTPMYQGLALPQPRPRKTYLFARGDQPHGQHEEVCRDNTQRGRAELMSTSTSFMSSPHTTTWTTHVACP